MMNPAAKLDNLRVVCRKRKTGDSVGKVQQYAIIVI
jgi:hypothetical protein